MNWRRREQHLTSYRKIPEQGSEAGPAVGERVLAPTQADPLPSAVSTSRRALKAPGTVGTK
jgi:hypothetical protein